MLTSIVVCPNHLTQQWLNEIVNNAEPPLKVFKFTTIREYAKATADDIATADAVIASIQFLNNGNYCTERFPTMVKI